MNNQLRVVSCVATAALASLFGGCRGQAGAWNSSVGPPQPVTRVQNPAVAAALDVARGLSQAFQDVSSRVAPAVVSVSSYGQERRGRRMAQGSGVIVSSDGTLVTNNHVIAGGVRFVATLYDGTRVTAQLLGSDAASDLAVLRLEGDDYTPAPLEDEREAIVGEWVIAVGHPGGIRGGHTVTAGIISGKGRGLGLAFYEDFLQTDAAINPGNSGGPLIDLDGRVLGINTAVGVPGQEHQGIGFTIPARMVRVVLDDILATGYVTRGWLGVHMNDVSAATVKQSGYKGRSRVVVSDVIENSPAASAGLLMGDLILAVGSRSVTSSRELLNAIGEVDPGTRLVVRVFREGRELDFPVLLDDRSVALPE